jgi:hypothetical protein
MELVKISESTFRKGFMMTKEIQENVCSDPTQSLTVELPCQLEERVERYAKENGYCGWGFD